MHKFKFKFKLSNAYRTSKVTSGKKLSQCREQVFKQKRLK